MHSCVNRGQVRNVSFYSHLTLTLPLLPLLEKYQKNLAKTEGLSKIWSQYNTQIVQISITHYTNNWEDFKWNEKDNQ